MSRTNLIDLSLDELESMPVALGSEPYRGRQLATWIYQKGVRDLEAMSDLSKPLRQRLAERYVIELPAVERVTPSNDGSRKLVLRLQDGARVQAVLMQEEERLTLCVSTQVGCGFGCAFCLTGTMGRRRDLTAGEIVGQVLAARGLLEAGARITHVVYMGMGEPLANYEATVASLRTLTDPRGLALSPRRITVSTVGLVPAMERLGHEKLRVNLAVSLHATTNATRDRLMPINRGFKLEQVVDACRRFPLPARQRITFEYVLLDRVNDSPDDARRLATFLRGLRAKVNLIPFNDWPGATFQRPPLARILAFQAILLERGVTATVRWSKGEDIGAACGQLKEAVPA
jgi:23S rRNA (adenine2503-C2)-methyltransferase